MREAGFGEAAIAAARAEAVRSIRLEPFRPHPANLAAVRLFLALQTQWRGVALSTMTEARLLRTGLDYGVVRETAELEQLALSLPDDFRRIRIMEAEAMDAWSQQARRAS